MAGVRPDKSFLLPMGNINLGDFTRDAGAELLSTPYGKHKPVRLVEPSHHD